MAKSSYEGKEQGQGKHTHTHTQEPYGIDIRQGAQAPKPFLLERKKNWHQLFQKEITPNQSNLALQCMPSARKDIIELASGEAQMFREDQFLSSSSDTILITKQERTHSH